MKALVLSTWFRHHDKILVMADQAVVSASNFVIGILISKLLGLDELGVYAFAWMVLMMCSSLLQNLISVPMVNHYLSIGQEEKIDYINRLVVLQLIISVLFSFVLFLLIRFPMEIKFFKQLSGLVYVLPFLIFAYLMQDFVRRLYLIKDEMKSLFVQDLIVNWSQVVFIVIAISVAIIPLQYILFFFAITYLMGGIPVFLMLWKHNVTFRGLQQITLQHWNMAKWLLASVILQWFAGNYFIISAGTLLGTESAGIIRIAQSIVGIMTVFFIALEFYVPPKAAIIFNKSGKKALVRYSIRIAAFGLILCVLFTVLLSIIAEDLIGIIYGDEYIQYSSVIVGFSVFYCVVFIGYPLRFILRAMNNMRDMFYAYVSATLFSVLCSAYIVRHYGIWGVIAGLIITQVIMHLWYIIAIVRYKEPERI